MTEKAKKPAVKKPAAKKTVEKKPVPAKKPAAKAQAPKNPPVKKPAPTKSSEKPETLSGITMIQKLASATAEIVKNNPPKSEEVTTSSEPKKQVITGGATGPNFQREVPFLNSTGPAKVTMPPTAVQVRKEPSRPTTINGKVTMSELIGGRKTKEEPKQRRPKHNFKFL